MGNVITISDFISDKRKQQFAEKLSKKINEVETELGIEDEPLTVLTDEAAINLANYLIDARDNINDCLSILNVEECEELPDGLE